MKRRRGLHDNVVVRSAPPLSTRSPSADGAQYREASRHGDHRPGPAQTRESSVQQSGRRHDHRPSHRDEPGAVHAQNGAKLWQQPQKYIAHSEIFFADRITTPLLLMTGGEDHNVPATNTREMYYALRRLGKPVTWANYSNGGHGAPNTTEADITDWHQRILDWYAKYRASPKKAATSDRER